MDEDGTEHYFKNTDDGYIDEDGLGLTLTLVDGGGYKITDKSNNVMMFSTIGNLYKIIQSNGNTITYQYDNTTIKYIKDESGRKINFEYDDSLNLTKIINWNNEETTYTYDNNGYLTTITDSNNLETSFEYDSDGALTKITAKNGSSINLGYTSLSIGKRVNIIEERGTEGNLGQTLRFGRGEYNQTTVISSGVDNIRYNSDDVVTKYEFDNAGRLISVYGYTSSGKELGANSLTMTSSAPKEDDSDIKKLNRITKLGGLSPTIINLLTDHSGESTNGWASSNSLDSITADYSATEDEHLFGQKSFKIDVISSANNGRSRFIQEYNDVKASTSYTLSAYVKSDNITIADASASGGAVLLVEEICSSGTKEYISEYITGTTNEEANVGWRRISVTFETSSEVETIRAMIVVVNATGTAYFDGIQLEEGETANSYNMIENPSFEKVTNDFADYWSGSNLITSDIIKTNAYKYGSNSIVITPNANASKEIMQTIPISGTEEDTYVLSG